MNTYEILLNVGCALIVAYYIYKYIVKRKKDNQMKDGDMK